MRWGGGEILKFKKLNSPWEAHDQINQKHLNNSFLFKIPFLQHESTQMVFLQTMQNTKTVLI